MDALNNILTRRSIRKYIEKEITNENINILLTAAMSAPSAHNNKDWCFIVVKDKKTLKEMSEANVKYAQMLPKAQIAILVCGDLDRTMKDVNGMWAVDCSAATENILLAANALGIGSVWLGVWPHMDRVKNQAELFNLPKTIIPHSLIALGYPDEVKKDIDRFDAGRVHYEKW